MNQSEGSHPVAAPAGQAGAPPLAQWRAVRAALLLFVAVLAALVSRPSAAQDSVDAGGTIAYVNATTGDEIRLVNADGSNNRRLWAPAQADTHDVHGVWSVDWRPDGSEIAFVSTHENACSINSSDIYVIGVDGGRYRRITQGPACAGLAAYPKGTVQVPVKNSSIFGNSFAGFAYFQGAPTIQPVSLPAGSSTMVTFNNVADFGDGALQLGAFIQGFNRDIVIGTAVDVKAGATVTTGQMNVYPPQGYWENRSPSWRSDGSQIGFFLNFASMLKLPPDAGPLELGEHLQTDNNNMPDFADNLEWGPPSKANQLLYRGSMSYDSQGVYLITEGSSGAGQKLVSYEVYEFVRGISWLPDGSGFVFSVDELNDIYEAEKSNIFEYNFASKQTKRITNFSNQFAGGLSVSPDGKQIVFDRANSKESDAVTDLYIINRDGTGLRLLASNGRAPDWGPAPVEYTQKTFLPSVLRPR